MTDEHASTEPIEQELRSLRPRDLSDEFVDSLGQRLERSRSADRPPRHPSMVKVLLSLVAVAALVLVAISLVRNLPTRDVFAPSKQDIAGPAGAPQEDQAYEPPKPSLIAYNHALYGPQGNLEKLLDYHARTLLPPVADPDSADER